MYDNLIDEVHEQLKENILFYLIKNQIFYLPMGAPNLSIRPELYRTRLSISKLT